MTIRERSIKHHPMNYKSETKSLSDRILYNVIYCSTTRYSIIISGNLREHCKYYDGIENLYFHSLVKDDTDICSISNCDHVKSLRSAI